jgi:hypothetical protein
VLFFNGNLTGFHGNLWEFMGFHGNLWEFMGIYGDLMGSNGIYPLVNIQKNYGTSPFFICKSFLNGPFSNLC